jgi:hypothetical protein
MGQLFALGHVPTVIEILELAPYDLLKELSMSKFAIGDKVDKATGGREGGVVVAVFLTDDGNFRYAVDMEGYGTLQFLTEERLVVHIS